MPSVIPEKSIQQKATPQPIGKLGSYLAFVTLIFIIGATLYLIGTTSQGEFPKLSLGKFIFQGEAPPPTPPSTEPVQEPVPTPNLPHYTADQVITIAKESNPECRAPAKRTG